MNDQLSPVLNYSLICIGCLCGTILGISFGRLKAAQLPEEMYHRLVRWPHWAFLATLAVLFILLNSWWALGALLLCDVVFFDKSKQDLKQMWHVFAETLIGPKHGPLGRWSRPTWVLIQLICVASLVLLQKKCEFFLLSLGALILCKIFERLIEPFDARAREDIENEPWPKLILNSLGLGFWLYILDRVDVWHLESVSFWPAIGLAILCSLLGNKLWTIGWILSHPRMLRRRPKMQYS